MIFGTNIGKLGRMYRSKDCALLSLSEPSLVDKDLSPSRVSTCNRRTVRREMSAKRAVKAAYRTVRTPLNQPKCLQRDFKRVWALESGLRIRLDVVSRRFHRAADSRLISS